jgi:hypothetical protein
MVVLLINTFRDKPFLFDDFMAWQRIQSFINASVNKFTQEVLSLKQKVVENVNNGQYF